MSELKYEIKTNETFGSGLFRIYDDKVEYCKKNGSVKWSKKYSELNEYSFKQGSMLLNGEFSFDGKYFDQNNKTVFFEAKYNQIAREINEYIESHRGEFLGEKKRIAEEKNQITAKASLESRINALLNRWDEICKTDLKEYKQKINKDKDFCMYMGCDNEKLYFADKNYRQMLSKVNNEKFLDAIEKVHGEPEKWLTVINIDDVQYFKFEGNMNVAHDVHGSGGGVNVDGAIVGGMLFGGAGAVIGSGLGTDISVSTNIIEYDNRFINLIYQDKTRTTKSISLPYAMKDALMTIMPEKEFSYIQLNNKPKEEPKADIGIDDQIEAIKKLKDLLDVGVLTQEEFDAKKKQILGI